MKLIRTFSGQNWLITPAALAVNQPRPQSIRDQSWLFILSGVAIVDLQGNSQAQWLHETLIIDPDFRNPLNSAVDRHSIPRPPGTDYRPEFQLDQWSPFAATSVIFNQGESLNSGFAVNVWRPNPFQTGSDAFGGPMLNNLFSGIQVDVAVRDTDAWLYRVSYNFTLLGKIVFSRRGN